MTRVLGIDGCPGGWVAAERTDDGIAWHLAGIADVGTLLPPDSVVGVDMPIGLLESGRRACDDLARHELRGAASRVFTTPPRAVLELGAAAPNDETQALCRRLMGVGVSRQALHLADRILALDAVIPHQPTSTVREVHPELSFREMTGTVLASKHRPEGVRQRLDAVAGWLPGADGAIAGRPPRVPVIDALDALAALWSALRWAAGTARTLPADASAPPAITV